MSHVVAWRGKARRQGKLEPGQAVDAGDSEKTGIASCSGGANMCCVLGPLARCEGLAQRPGSDWPGQPGERC